MFFTKYGIKSRNIPLFFFSTFIGGMLFFLPILALYFEKSLFTLTNVAIIFSIEAIAMVIFEVPTGAFAELFGRKKTTILAHFVALIAVVFLYIGGNMFMFGLFAILNSLARSLASGTDSALIYDSLKEENKEKYYKKIIGVFYALWPLGASLGSIIGGYLAIVSLSFPVLITLIPLSIAFILTFFIKEPNYEKEKHRNIFRHMIHSSRTIFGSKQLAILIFGSFVLWGVGESVHRLTPIFFQFKEIPIVYFGYLAAFVFGLSSLGYYLSYDISEKIGNKLTLILSVILSPLFLIFAVLTTNYTSAVFFIIPSLFFGLRNPIISHLVNLEVSSKQRATIASISNFIGELGTAIFIPFVGYLADLYTINTAFKLSAIIMFIIPLLYLFLKDKN